MEKLPIEFKEKWIAALESGEYKKGETNLYTAHRNSFCCLGVACIILGAKEEDIDDACFIETGLANLRKIPNGMPDVLIGDCSSHIIESITELNDNNDSFAPVIEYIKENL